MAKSDTVQKLEIRLPDANYPIYIGHQVLEDASLLKKYISSSQVCIISNDKIAPIYLERLKKNLEDKSCDVLVLQDGETFKNQDSLFAIYELLINKKHHRDTTLIALGGGVVGDITGFAAATYQRGVPFIQIPTSLLAQVDASVGGKTAINYHNAKNMIGSFYQPKAVMIDINTLKTLDSREFKAGLAEIIKYALIEGGDFFNLVFNALEKGLDADSNELAQIISQCCAIKAKIVEQDEKEHSIRALLNLGHTIGHALEAQTLFTRYLHGEAVAIGLYVIAVLSYHHSNLSLEELEIVDKMLRFADLPRRIPKDIDLQKLRYLMSNDKKIINNQLRFIMMKAIGHCYIDNNIAEETLSHALAQSIEGES